uniref:Dynein axonemal heavy chain 5 n=1 Tax=Anolis carolinensis TaxID=28377 RepID=G1KES7_ANOCA
MENIKELQQKLKEEKEAKQAHLDGRHDYIFSIIASCVVLEKAEVEDAILEGNQIERIDKFFTVGGFRHVMFYYQDMEGSETGPGSSAGINSQPAKNKKHKLFVTEGNDVALTGICVFFIRTNPSKVITAENIHREVVFNMMDTTHGGLLNSVQHLLSDIFIPALKTMNHGWGELSGPWKGMNVKQDFLASLEGFVSVLLGAQQSLLEKVNLKECDTYDLKTLKGPTDYLIAANSTETLERIEACMKVIAENSQLRKEADDLGPRAELDHWKKRLSKFNYLLDQLKTPDVKAVLGVLTVAKSKLLKSWRELDIRITDAANEAKDNVKYLYTLEKCCDPLYNSDPVMMVDAIPGLVHAIKMIHNISRYYNTSEKITSLFVKVTNQMITACKAYITNNNTATIWDQPQDVVLEKIQAAIRLKQEYQNYFHKTKQKLEQRPAERQFDFSEMYIFGKFETFHRRLLKIMKIFDIITTYSVLQDSKMEGLEVMATKYQGIVTTMKKKQYNFLDQRKSDFDQDYEEFCKQSNDLHQQLQTFMDITFENIANTERTLYMLKKFERLGIPKLGIDEKYQVILQNYGHEIDVVSKLYSKQKNDPPLGRNLPPMAGKILWARQLFQRIQEPISLFQKNSTVLQTAEARPIIHNYNRVAKILLEFEVVYHRGWLQQVQLTKAGLQASLLVKAPDNGEIFVNFDPEILTLIRETQCMARMGLEIPPFAIALQQKSNSYKQDMMLEEYKRVKSKIQAPLHVLMAPHVAKVDEAMQPGMTTLTWTSLNIEMYLQNILDKLADLELLLDRINDLIEFRINAVLQEMSTVPLSNLPEDDPLTCEQFLHMTKELCIKGAYKLHLKSSLVEEATNELINMLLDLEAQNKNDTESRIEETDEANFSNQLSTALSTPLTKKKKKEMEMLEEEAQELLSHFNHRNVDALLKVTRNTLETIRKRIQAASIISFLDNENAFKQKPSVQPIFQANVILSIPNFAIMPALEEVQQTLSRAVDSIVSVMKGVGQWSKERLSKKGMLERKMAALQNDGGSDSENEMQQTEVENIHSASLSLPSTIQTKNYYKIISENKEIIKLMSVLSTAITSTKRVTLEHFKCYHHIWQQEKEETIEDFVKGSPLLSEFESQILYYRDLELEINSEPEYICVGTVALYTEDLKLALTTETKSWMVAFGHHCNKTYRTEMENIFTSVEEISKKLNRQIKDLDDIRIAMAALKEIREQQILIDFQVGPIEESYAMLNKYELLVAKEEIEKVDTLRYTWEKLLVRANEVQNELVALQPKFRGELISTVEIFVEDCDQFYLDYDTNGPMVAGLEPQEASDRLIMFQNRFDNLYRKYITYTGGEELFGLPVTQYPQLLEIKKQLSLLQKLYGLYNSVIETVNGYYDILWSEVNIEKINNELLEFQNRCRKLPRALKEWQAFLDLKKTIDDFNECCPLFELMSNKAMMARHWKRITELTGHNFHVENETFKLRNIMDAPLLKYKEEIEDICISAVKEKDIEQKLKQVIAEWDNKMFTFANFKTRGELLLRGDSTSETIASMEDSLMVLGSLMSNRYNTPFKVQIQKWVQYLSNTTDIIENWMTVQNLWIYLEAVFVGGDIAKQLPKEAKRFSNIDKSWVKIMTRAHEIPNVVQCCVGDETMGQLLPHLLDQLEICQKSLTGYLEKKRLSFPRFFFVSDPALLEILGQASDSHTIQAHLLNVFDNIKSVKFHEKIYDRILSISSREGETIELEKPVMAEGNVEVWLNSLLMESQASLHLVIRQAAASIQESDFQLIEFLSSFPAQASLFSFFLQKKKKKRKEKKEKKRKEKKEKRERDDYDPNFCRMHIKSPTDFEWLKQCRFYFSEDADKMMINITDVTFTYQNEFLGCTDRLVITPLTDRCYITLAQALGMSMGGAPAGPAGTGKTETTKDMGRCLGKYVVVFNCSDQMDFRGLGRIFKGLAQSGSWGCFDEFNRIDLPVLSVAAQQIAIILTCKKERKKSFIFTDGDNVEMNPEFGLFLTMNPGYAGRQELPENLKINFRSVAMMVPDRQIIIRVKLASCGFIDNIVLARKFFTLYKLCEEQLSKQVHYDFGLRNILSVLRTLGAAKRSNPEDTESTIVMRVLRDMNLSKLIDEDEPLFLSLIEDLFPSIQLDKAGYPELEAAISKQVEEAGLINHPPWRLKVIQLFETQRVRHGMMALGPSGAGKTTCIHTLMKSMTDCGQPHREMRMNPKAITAPQMFGRLDVATNDWTDGIFSTLWRKTLRAKKGEHIWIVLDGPVDAIWIENLNSVLDDNKTLTLANGDRIPMAPNCKIVFEPHNIDNASPATVSRNGMVFMSSSVLNWSPILEGFLKKRCSQEAEILRQLYAASFPELYRFSIQSLEYKIEMLEAFVIMQSINMLQGLIPCKEQGGEITAEFLERLYIFSLMWSIGALLELEDRRKMERWLCGHETIRLDLPNIPETSEDTMFDYYVTNDGKWMHWNTCVEEYVYPSNSTPEYGSILVPNVDNVRTDFLIQTISKQGKAVLLIGEQGTAKTVIIKGCMSKYNPESHMAKSLNFSSATTPLMFQRTIESYVDKRMGTTYGPPAGKKMTVFIDDVNMPVINEWGDQVTNEIVRQLMEQNGFYNLEKPGEFTNIVDIQFLAAMIHPGGGRNDIPQRLKRQFSVFNCTLPSNSSIDKIFGVIGIGHYCSQRGFIEEVRTTVAKLVPLTRRLWQMTKNKMLPTPAKFHYVFNLRDLSRIWQGMLNTIPEVLIKLWKHECKRVIADRFTIPEDVAWFDVALAKLIEEEFGVDKKALVHPNIDAYFVDFLRDAPEATDCCHHVIVEELQNVHKFVRAPNFLEDGPKSAAIHCVKCLCKVNECHVQRLVLFPAFILELSCSEDHIHCSSGGTEAILGFWEGDVLLATAFLSYSGPFNQEFRNLLLNGWQQEMKTRKIPFGNNLNLTEMLIDAPTVSEWNLQGLPNDDLSIQNGIIVTKAARYPLLIDPQTQGKIWIKNKETRNELQITSLNHKYFRSHLEDSLSLGRPMLIEDVGEELDPALDNVLERNFIKTGSTYKVKVGDKEMDVMNGFRLYITTKLPNPAYTPEISARTSIIDFTVTMKGLEDQLLGRVILTEKQELEKERTDLMEDVTANKRKMKELEDNLLYRLTSTQGSLVEDESLIIVLSNTKKTAEEVTQKLQISAETEVQINSAREEYRPVATRGSILYFLITEMSMVNVMYQTSLRQFLGLFDLSLARSVKSPITNKRIANIIEHMTYEVYKYAARGLYEEHKFLFTLLLTLKIDLQRGRVKHEEFLTLIKGGASLDLKACPLKPAKWILDMTWLSLVELSKLRQFSDVLDQISRTEKQWKIWFDKEKPEEEHVPSGYDQALDCFRRLLLIRSWCPDRTIAQARKYIMDTMGEKYAEGVILDLEKTWEESDPRTPLICFLSMGSDPTDSIIALGKRLKIETRYVSMGQGQEVHARKLLQQTMANGGWALLQNCHLGLDFIDELMDTVVETETVHEAFRLWMTTEVHKHFPITLLQMSIKFTNEPPQGLKAGLKRTYGGVSQDLLDISNMIQWKPMLYAVAFLHSTVQERRKFGPLGWNIPYEFNQADFNATIQFVQNHLDDMDMKKGVSWNTVRYMIGEIQYGGRVTDDYDKRLLNTFAKVWFNETMFSQDFSFYKGYSIPKCTSVDQYLQYIQGLPAYDTPEVFGLHPNADITYQSKLAKDVLDTILSIQPKDSSSGGGETREAVVARLADDMLEKLPADYVPFEIKERLQQMGPFQPMNIFLRQEIDRMQRIIALVRNTLTDLKLAIDGTIIMSENLRDALDCMYDARIPERWKKASWTSSTLGFWFTELLERNWQFHCWIFEGRPNCFWMTGFFNPQGFLTAMRQEITRANKGWALDSVVLCNEVTKWMKDDITIPPSEGVYVYGLYLEGAGWDKRNMKLIESKPKVLFEPMPVIRIYAENNTAKDPWLYSCPIYKKPVRTDLNYIAAVDLRTTQSPEHWILRGVALLCDVK